MSFVYRYQATLIWVAYVVYMIGVIRYMEIAR